MSRDLPGPQEQRIRWVARQIVLVLVLVLADSLGLPQNRKSTVPSSAEIVVVRSAVLQDAAVSSHGGHVAGLVEEPESLPFGDERAQVFRSVEQLLDTSFGASRIDGHKASDRGGQAGRQQSELDETSHRAFLRERFANDSVQ